MTLLNIIVASFLVSFISFAGAIFLFWEKIFTEKLGTYFVSFAAGTMIAVSFFDLLPEALEKSNSPTTIFTPVFWGIMAFFFLERFILWFHHHDSTHETKPTAVLILLGDGVHNFIDGLAIAATFIASPNLGILTTLAISAHEIPQEIADLSVLIHGGMPKRRALFFNFLSGLTAMIGAIGGFFFLEKLEGAIPILLAFTAGMFIYIACSDLIPELHQDFKKGRRWAQSIPFVLGILILYFAVSMLEH